jgi:trimeric autotransporter adhesin
MKISSFLDHSYAFGKSLLGKAVSIKAIYFFLTLFLSASLVIGLSKNARNYVSSFFKAGSYNNTQIKQKEKQKLFKSSTLSKQVSSAENQTDLPLKSNSPTTANISVVKSASVSSVVPNGTIDYTVVISNNATATSNATGVVFNDVLSNDLTLVAGSLKATPIAAKDNYTSLRNVGITVPAANGLLANDISPDNTALSITAVTNATTFDGGKITIQTNGAIDYTPKTGTTATTDSYIYTLNSSNGKTNTDSVKISLNGNLWFVNKAATSNGDGSLASPFQDWSNFGSVNTGGSGKPDNDHTIFIYSNASAYSGAVTLRSGQKILGQGASTSLVSFAGLSLPTYSKTLPTVNGARPNLTSSGSTITLNVNNTLQGFNMGNSTIDITGSNFNLLTISEMALDGNGQALGLSSGSLAATFTNLSSTNSAAQGISLTSITGTLTNSGSCTINNPTTTGITIASASTLNANFGITNISGSGSAGLSVTGGASNTATLTFADFDIAPDAGIEAINYAGRGSLTSTSGTITTSNTSGTTGGIAITGASSTQKASLAIVLDSYTNTGNAGTSYGMSISNTTGSFTINGVGTTAGSGGTISNCSLRGANFVDASNITLKNMNFTNSSTSTTACSTPASDNSNCNAAIHAKTVSGLALTNVAITGNHKNMGVNLNKVSNFTLANSTITAVGGATGVGGNEAGGIYALNLSGTCSITSSNINESNGRNFYCYNGILSENPTLSLTVTSCQFKNTFGKSVGGANFLFSGNSSSNNTLIFKSNDFSNPRTYGLFLGFNNSSINTVQVGGNNTSDGNTIVAATSLPGSNAFALQTSSASSATVNYNILNNNFQSSFNGGDIFNIGNQGTGLMQGRCNNNTAAAVSTNGSNGILIAQYGSGNHRSEVHNNTISGVNNLGISVDARDNGIPGSNGRVDASVLNNNISLTSTGYAHVNVTAYADDGSTSTMKSCVRVGGNITNSVASAIAEFDVVSTPSPSQVILQGTTAYIAPAFGSRTPNLTNFWKANNGGVGTGIDESGEGAFGGSSPIGSIISGTCIAPSNPVASRLAAPVATVNTRNDNRTIIQPAAEIALIENNSSLASPVNTLEQQFEQIVLPTSINTSNNNNTTARNNAGETVTVNGTGSGFTIPIGKSTTITFSTTVAADPVTCIINNQATVNGSNFTTVNSNITATTITFSSATSVGPSTVTNICKGTAVNLVANCASGTPTWYTTSTGGTAIGTGASLSVTPMATTTYYVSCQNGCNATARVATAQIIVAEPSLATANTNQTKNITGNTYFENNCMDLIALVKPNGATPISGNTTAKLWIETAQPVQFVKRHYEITPATNASSATGKVTLYFTQQEFNDFNAVNTNDLPTGTADATGKANLLIEKRGGTSGDASGLPDSYTGTITTIDPADADIIWNATQSRWEVSFDVTGFSGFFVKTISSILPLKWISVNAHLNNQKQAVINWKVQETNVVNYTLEKSTDGINFYNIGMVNSKGDGENNYTFTETNYLNGKAYYRIKQTERDGRTSFSRVMTLITDAINNVNVYPNPSADMVTISSNGLINTNAILRDVNGRLLQTIRINTNNTPVNLSNYASGIYMLQFSNGKIVKIVKQ